MGVDISHIIKNDFHDIENHEEALRFVETTIKQLSLRLTLPNDVDWELEDRYIDPNTQWRENSISFRLPVYDVEFTLHNGFWVIESFYHYCQIVMHRDEYFWLRELTFDLAIALKQTEAWYAQEFYTWNGYLDVTGPTFEQWLAHCRNKYGKEIPEFDRDAIMAQGDVHIPEYEPLYHDTFNECFKELSRLQLLVGSRGKVIGLNRVSRFIRCDVEGGVNLFDDQTNSFIFPHPVEGVLSGLNGAEFLVKRGRLSALFDGEGHQLSDYVDGDWGWEWCDYSIFQRRIYNKKNDLSFIVP